MTGLVEVTTYSGRLRHLTHPEWLHQREYGRMSRGTGICNSAVYVEVYDQVAFDAARARYNAAFQQVLISSLPLCKRCEKKSGGAA